MTLDISGEDTVISTVAVSLSTIVSFILYLRSEDTVFAISIVKESERLFCFINSILLIVLLSAFERQLYVFFRLFE